MRRPPYVCWLDLETAGSDNRDPIMEIGAILCRNDEQMTVEAEFVNICRIGPAHVDAMDDVVRQMHTDNGLLEQCLSSKAHPIGMVDARFDRWIRDITESTDHVALAGSGVSHFDRRLIATQIPLTHKRFTYWAYDVGSVRRMLDRIAPSFIYPQPEGGKAHRAMADAADHRDEWLHYETLIGSQLRGEE